MESADNKTMRFKTKRMELLMKTVLMSSAFALALAPAAFADQIAVVDFNDDGIIGATDYIGPKSALDTVATQKVIPAQYEWKETERTVVIPGSTSVDVVPVTALAPTGDNYVNIGEYRGGVVGTLETVPAATRTVVERERVLVEPARTVGLTTEATVYPNPHGSVEANVSASLQGIIYDVQNGSDGVLTASELGYVDDEFVNDRLAEYDTNGDGIVTTDEAIAHVDPLIDPNVAAVRGNINGVNAIVTPEQKDL